MPAEVSKHRFRPRAPHAGNVSYRIGLLIAEAAIILFPLSPRAGLNVPRRRKLTLVIPFHFPLYQKKNRKERNWLSSMGCFGLATLRQWHPRTSYRPCSMEHGRVPCSTNRTRKGASIISHLPTQVDQLPTEHPTGCTHRVSREGGSRYVGKVFVCSGNGKLG